MNWGFPCKSISKTKLNTLRDTFPYPCWQIHKPDTVFLPTVSGENQLSDPPSAKIFSKPRVVTETFWAKSKKIGQFFSVLPLTAAKTPRFFSGLRRVLLLENAILAKFLDFEDLIQPSSRNQGGSLREGGWVSPDPLPRYSKPKNPFSHETE